MKRKEFINRLSLGTGAAILIPSVCLLQSCEYQPTVRTTIGENDIPLLDEIGETIIPTTASSPGAKATNIGAYMVLMYQECMPREEQIIFLDGLNELDKRSAEAFSTTFGKATTSEKLEFIEILRDEAKAYSLSLVNNEEAPPHYVDLLKNLIISGYFSSKIGMTQAREHLPLPGKFVACISYNEGDKPWAT